MIIPKNGNGLPCCADCAEHNAEGCPGGRSPFCTGDTSASVEYGILHAQEAIETCQAGVLALVEHSLTGRQGEKAYSAARYYCRQAVESLQLAAGIVDDCKTANDKRMLVRQP